jgi:myo-inositol-1(or 4)-monophosphatase
MDSAICAAVLAPPTDDLFLAVRGEGATCNGESIKAPKADSVDRAIIGSGFPYYFEDPYKTNLPEWAAVTVKALAGRCSGAAALDLCDVARGRLDAFWEIELEPWDIVAGALIAREAGAITTLARRCSTWLADEQPESGSIPPRVQGHATEDCSVRRIDTFSTCSRGYDM